MPAIKTFSASYILKRFSSLFSVSHLQTVVLEIPVFLANWAGVYIFSFICGNCVTKIKRNISFPSVANMKQIITFDSSEQLTHSKMYTQDLDNDPRGTGSVTEFIEMQQCSLCDVNQPADMVHFFQTVRMHVCADCQQSEIKHAAEAEDVDYLEELVNFKF